MKDQPTTPWKELESIAQVEGIDYEYGSTKFRNEERQYLRLGLPAQHSDTRPLFVYKEDAPMVLEANFHRLVFLGSLAACLDRNKGVIEAICRSATRLPARSATIQWLVDIFGVDPQADSATPFDGVALEDEVDDAPLSRPRFSAAMLKLEGGALEAEFSQCSPILRKMEVPNFATETTLSLKLECSPELTHDEALDYLTRFSAALFFELDVNYGINLSLAESRRSRSLTKNRPVPRQEATTRRPAVPRQAYNADAVSLYTYGRSAQGMPLLEFLAYYQVIEYFFPTYTRAELVQRFRREFRDPRFDPDSDTDVGRLLQILAGSGRGRLDESDQLKATLRHCVEEQALRDFIESEPERLKFLTGKQGIKGVRSIDLKNRSQALTDQVSDRVFELRCRIVHSKEDGGPRSSEMILPFSPEARQLNHDLALARFLAQKVLIMAAKPAPWQR